MIKNQYINNELENLEKEEEKLQKYERIDFISMLASTFLGTMAACTIFILPPLGLATGAGFGWFYYQRKKQSKIKNQILNRINQEKSHLKKINPVIDSKLNKKREKKLKKIKKVIDSKLKKKKKKKVELLKQLQKEKEKKVNRLSRISKISAMLTIGGAIATVFVPPLAIASAAGLAATILGGNLHTRKHQENEVLKNRIHNLETDIDIVEIEKEELKKSKEKQKQKKSNNIKEKENTKNLEQEKMVDEYISNLEKTKEKEKGKVKVKK